MWRIIVSGRKCKTLPGKYPYFTPRTWLNYSRPNGSRIVLYIILSWNNLCCDNSSSRVRTKRRTYVFENGKHPKTTTLRTPCLCLRQRPRVRIPKQRFRPDYKPRTMDIDDPGGEVHACLSPTIRQRTVS